MILYLVLSMSYAHLLCVVLLPYPWGFLLKIMHPHILTMAYLLLLTEEFPGLTPVSWFAAVTFGYLVCEKK